MYQRRCGPCGPHPYSREGHLPPQIRCSRRPLGARPFEELRRAERERGKDDPRDDDQRGHSGASPGSRTPVHTTRTTRAGAAARARSRHRRPRRTARSAGPRWETPRPRARPGALVALRVRGRAGRSRRSRSQEQGATTRTDASHRGSTPPASPACDRALLGDRGVGDEAAEVAHSEQLICERQRDHRGDERDSIARSVAARLSDDRDDQEEDAEEHELGAYQPAQTEDHQLETAQPARSRNRPSRRGSPSTRPPTRT